MLEIYLIEGFVVRDCETKSIGCLKNVNETLINKT